MNTWPIEVAQKDPRLTWFRSNVANWPMLTVIAVSFICVYLLPHEWLWQQGWFRTYAEWILAVLPGQRTYVEVSSIRPVAQVYYPLMVPVSLLALLEIPTSPHNPDKWYDSPRRTPVKSCFLLLGQAALVIVFFWYCASVGGQQLQSIPVNSSHLALASVGAFLSGAAGFALLGLWLRAIKSFFWSK